MNVKVLQTVRQANGMTLDEAARRSGVSAIYISQLENGRKSNPSIYTIAKLASAYNLTERQMTELDNCYENLKIELSGSVDDDRRRRLTMIKALIMIEENLYPLK